MQCDNYTCHTDTALLDRPSSGYVVEDPRESDAWLDLHTELNEWLRDPESLVEPGGSPPSKWTIRAARNWLYELKQSGSVSAPSIMAPDNAGGLALEWHSHG